MINIRPARPSELDAYRNGTADLPKGVWFTTSDGVAFTCVRCGAVMILPGAAPGTFTSVACPLCHHTIDEVRMSTVSEYLHQLDE